MNQNTSFYRKIAYLAGLAVLLFPLSQLGAPATRDEEGGKLAVMRRDNRLGQADLGAIDPASETIRLATLGLRGVAVSMLWTKANEAKKTEDWTTFQSTLEQLARLQPYFIKVWQFQAWNLTYNVSVESDDVRDRFYYVKQGIKYLKEGIGYNRENPSLLADLGWFHGNKVGRADEHEIYRKLYRANSEDDILYPPETTPEKRDNWLVSRGWYEEAIGPVDAGRQSLGTKNPTTFFDSPARSQISYADAIESEGVFGPRAQEAWKEGARLWEAYGNRLMPSSFDTMIRLGDLEKVQAEGKKLAQELEGLSPGMGEKLASEAVQKLTPAQREALQKTPESPNDEYYKLRDEATEATNITVDKIAEAIAKSDPAKASQARQIANRMNENSLRLRMIETNRDVSNFAYWSQRCELEQTPEALKARELSHEAKRAFEDADPTGAKQLYEESFDLWSKALDRVPELGADSPTGSDIMDFVEEYVKVLEQLDLRLSDKAVMDKFALWRIVAENNAERKYDADLDAWRSHDPGGGRRKSPAVLDQGTPTLVNPADAFSGSPG